MSTVIFAFAEIFRDFGLTNAVLRKGSISQSELSLIFWFNAAATVALCAVIAAISPGAAVFYHEPIVQWVMLTSLIGFLATGVTLQHRAIVSRDLRFVAIAITDTICSIAGLVVTLALAVLWRDVWAIVWGTVIQALLSATIYVKLSNWRPQRFKRTEELASLLRFGGNTSVYSISVFVSQNISSILIGHLMGSSNLGQYNRAQALLNLPTANLIQPITQAAAPLMARLRPYPEEYRAAYLGMVRRLCAFLVPMAAALTIASVPLVEAILGKEWQLAGYTLMALSPVLAVLGLLYSVSDLFVTQDRSNEMRNLGLAEMTIRVGTIFVGLRFGLIGAAAAFTVATTIVGIIRIFVAGRSGPVTARDQFSQILPSLPLTAGAAIGGLAARMLLPLHSSGLTAVAALTSAAVFAMIIGLAFRSSRAAILDLAEMFGSRKVAALFRIRRV
jgi:PST family polysaccharide transporter